MRTIEWKEGVVLTVDQTKLPERLHYIKIHSCSEMVAAIKNMKLRGAPLIGIAAAYGLALLAYHSSADKREALLREVEEGAEILQSTRPTAVNLFWGIDRIIQTARKTPGSGKVVADAIIEEAQKMADEDVQINRLIGEYGANLIEDGDTILTHCNAGSLATVDYGTALGVIRAAWNKGKHLKVIATETRPKLQGARLTAYELKREGIPVTLITDNMVGYVMANSMVNKVVVGADRIVQDAVLNKIGTYTIAVLAREHHVPFYIAAPISTMDLNRTVRESIIEQRNPQEVTHVLSKRIAPEGIEALNPAFDVTPMEYVNAVITEKGVLNSKDLARGRVT